MPEPSVQGGYHEDAFTLELTVPKEGKIYYTTDGSTPTTNSNLYTDGIEIRNCTQEPNIYNSIPQVVEDWLNYAPDETPVEKGTVVRAVFVNEFGLQSDVFTQTYFVGMEPPEQGYTLNLIFDYEDLFGSDGIYVTGGEYDKWYLAADSNIPAPEANFRKKLEAVVTAEFIDSAGVVNHQPVGLRIQGSSDRAWAKKRFSIFSRTELSGSETFHVNLFDEVTSHSAMTKDIMADYIVADLVSDRSVAVQHSLPVRLFLNGEYWDDTYLLEKYDQQFFRQYYDVNDSVVVKISRNNSADEQRMVEKYCGEYWAWTQSLDLTDPLQWEQFLQKTDVQSYIDFIIVNYYLCNIDMGQGNNYVFWRSAAREASRYGDMRWRWCIYDVDAINYAAAACSVENAAEINVFRIIPPGEVKASENKFFFAHFLSTPISTVNLCFLLWIW